MKNSTKRKVTILLVLGLFIMVTSQIFAYYTEFSDFAKGSLMGIGIGLLGTSLMLGNFKTIHR